MNQLATIPIIQQALFFLREAGSANGIKVTETGALGRNFVQALWDQLLKTSEDDLIFRPTRELECPEATRIHFLLSENKYVRKYKGKIYLTEKGRSILSRQDYRELYHDLLAAQIFLWNWGYEDRYPDYEFIQRSSEVLLAALYAWPASTISPEQLYYEVFEEIFAKEAKEIKDDLCRCLTVRFFYRFCIPFGIIKSEEGDRFLDKRITDSFEKTYFFMTGFMTLMKSPEK